MVTLVSITMLHNIHLQLKIASRDGGLGVGGGGGGGDIIGSTGENGRDFFGRGLGPLCLLWYRWSEKWVIWMGSGGYVWGGGYGWETHGIFFEMRVCTKRGRVAFEMKEYSNLNNLCLIFPEIINWCQRVCPVKESKQSSINQPVPYPNKRVLVWLE